MISLALLGKDIAHSKSQKIYTELLSQDFNYTKYDIADIDDIPTLDEIFSTASGLSITSPYKRHFLSKVSMTEEIKNLNAINCIKKKSDNTFEGTNTDYLALKDIFVKLIDHYKLQNFVILGAGSMSHVTQILAKELKIEFQVLSRNNNDDLEDIKLESSNKGCRTMIINACSRHFIHRGLFDSGIIFLDYNYNFRPHLEHFIELQDRYIDGIGLLKSQAEYALKFWQISN